MQLPTAGQAEDPKWLRLQYEIQPFCVLANVVGLPTSPLLLPVPPVGGSYHGRDFGTENFADLIEWRHDPRGSTRLEPDVGKRNASQPS